MCRFVLHPFCFWGTWTALISFFPQNTGSCRSLGATGLAGWTTCLLFLARTEGFYLHCVHPDFWTHTVATGDCLSQGCKVARVWNWSLYSSSAENIMYWSFISASPCTWCSLQHRDNFKRYDQAEHHLFDWLARTRSNLNLFLIPGFSRSRSNVVRFTETPIAKVSNANSRFQKAGIV
jgi:hypothetical protein